MKTPCTCLTCRCVLWVVLVAFYAVDAQYEAASSCAHQYSLSQVKFRTAQTRLRIEALRDSREHDIGRDVVMEVHSRLPIGAGQTHALEVSPTFCVYTRIIDQELPYVESFVKHYASLGVRAIYMLSNQVEHRARLKHFLARLSEKHGPSIVIYFRSGGADSRVHAKELVSKINEDFIIGVDIDEFWVLPQQFERLSEFVAHQPADLYNIPWRVVVNDRLAQGLTPPYHAYEGPNHKWMARKSLLKNIHLHDPELLPGSHKVTWESGSLLHFCARSFWDVATKSLAQQFTGKGRGAYHGCEGAHELIRLLKHGSLPWRVKLLAFQANVPNKKTIESGVLMTYNGTLEQMIASELLGVTAEASAQFMQELHTMYEDFKFCVKARMDSQPVLWAQMREGNLTKFLENVGCDGAPLSLLTLANVSKSLCVS